jgi:hypothetical protein
VVELEFSVYERSFYLRLHSLGDDVSSPATLTNRLRDAKALYYEGYAADDEHDETDLLSPHGSGVPDEWTQIDQLRSAVIQTRQRQAGRNLAMWLLVAVAIVIALVLTATVGWANF